MNSDSKFEQPILFKTFGTDEMDESPFDNKCFIQFTNKSGIFIIRLGEKRLEDEDSSDEFTEEESIDRKFQKKSRVFFYSINGDHNSYDTDNISLLAAPPNSEAPCCFIVKDKTVFRIDYNEKIFHESKIYDSFFKIVSLYANNEYIYIGTSNCLIQINSIDKTRRFIYLSFAKEESFATSSYEDYIFTVTSRSYLNVIHQNTLSKFKIPLTFTITHDIQIKIGKINEVYLAAILSDSKIHLISFKIRPFFYFYQLSIPAENVISYDVHNNSIVVLREIDYYFNSISGRTSRISVYPCFSNDPQYEWDIIKELEFVYKIDTRPSVRQQILNDKFQHISYSFGYIQNDDIDTLIENFSAPAFISTDSNDNLWIVTQYSLLYFVPITEEMASFRGMLNNGYNYSIECSKNASKEDIIKFIYAHYYMLSADSLKTLFNSRDVSRHVNSLNDIGKFVKELNDHLHQTFKQDNQQNYLEITRIARRVYEQMDSFMHSEIDFTIVHNNDQIKDAINKLVEEFCDDEDLKKSSDEIANMFGHNLSNIEEYIDNYNYEDKSSVGIQVNQSLIQYANDFWLSAIIGQSYQLLKYFISLLSASYLFKKLKLTKNPQIHNKFCILNSRIEENVCSFASIYAISLYHFAGLKLQPLDFSYKIFRSSLFKQFSFLFNSTYFLSNFIKQKQDLDNLILQAKGYSNHIPTDSKEIRKLLNILNKIVSIIRGAIDNDDITNNKLKDTSLIIKKLNYSEKALEWEAKKEIKSEEEEKANKLNSDETKVEKDNEETKDEAEEDNEEEEEKETFIDKLMNIYSFFLRFKNVEEYEEVEPEEDEPEENENDSFMDKFRKNVIHKKAEEDKPEESEPIESEQEEDEQEEENELVTFLHKLMKLFRIDSLEKDENDTFYETCMKTYFSFVSYLISPRYRSSFNHQEEIEDTNEEDDATLIGTIGNVVSSTWQSFIDHLPFLNHGNNAEDQNSANIEETEDQLNEEEEEADNSITKDEYKKAIIEIEDIQKKASEFYTDGIDKIFSYSSNMKNPNHLLILSMINLEKGNFDFFFKYFRRFKFFNQKVPQIFYDFFLEKTKKKYPKIFVSFVNEEYKNLMFSVNSQPNESDVSWKLNFFQPFFLNAIEIEDYDSALNALMGLFSAMKISTLHARSVEYLVKSMKEHNCINKFTSFPFGIHLQKVLKILSFGSPTSLFIASSLYYRIGEYSKSGNVLLKYVNSVYYKINPTESELRKAKSAIILITSIINNHTCYIREPTTMHFIDNNYLNNLQLEIEKKILDKIDIAPNVSAKPANTKNDFPYSPSEAAFLLNNTQRVNVDTIKEYTRHFLSKPNINQQTIHFIKNLKNEEALQLFLAWIFDQNIQHKNMCDIKISGLWLHIVFAKHNIRCLNTLVRNFIIGKKDVSTGKAKEMYRHLKRANSAKQISMEILPCYKFCNSLLNEIFLMSEVENDVTKAEIIYNVAKKNNNNEKIIGNYSFYPFSTEITMKLLPLLQILAFNSMQTTYQSHLISKDISLTIKDSETKVLIICCPRGYIKYSIKTKGNAKINRIDKNDEFIIIRNFSSKELQITGEDDNTEVLISKYPK